MPVPSYKNAFSFPLMVRNVASPFLVPTITGFTTSNHMDFHLIVNACVAAVIARSRILII